MKSSKMPPRVARPLVALAHVFLLAASGAAQGQVSAAICGSFDEAQWDYRTASKRQHIEVEGPHFPPKVEALIAGNRGTLAGDIQYTLIASPNHHRALISATRLAERLKTDNVPGFRYTIECYYERAIRFSRDDAIVRMLYAQFLNKRGRESDALAQLQVAITLAGDNGFTHHNVGLIYLEMKRYQESQTQGHRAIALGFEGTALRDALKAVGKWVEPAGAGVAAAEANSAASSAKAD